MPSILGANTLSSGFDVANSVRLDGRDSDTRMEVTNSGAGNRQIFTFSTWIKRSALDSSTNFQVLYSAVDSGGNERIMFEEDKLTWDFDIAGVDYSVETSGRLYRDFSAWYHIVVTKDTTQSTEANRIKMYVNGVQQTLAEVQLGFPDQNANGSINMAIEHQLFAQADGEEFGGYACETVFIDGTAYAADSFGEFDEDSPTTWKPKNVSGLTFGTNGFYLKFEDSSALGADSSGNGNNYATANLAATDQSTDTCTNNFATMNPLVAGTGATFSEGSLAVGCGTNATYNYSASTIGVDKGKWYLECKVSSSPKATIGIIFDGDSGNVFNEVINNRHAGNNGTGWAYKPGNNGAVEHNGANISYSTATADENDVIGVALDLDNDRLYFSKNGTFLNSGNTQNSTGAIDISSRSGNVFISIGDSDSSSSTTTTFNFGSPPYAISSGNADADGHGNFEHAVPSGYFALNTKNLAEYG